MKAKLPGAHESPVSPGRKLAFGAPVPFIPSSPLPLPAYTAAKGFGLEVTSSRKPSRKPSRFPLGWKPLVTAY